MPHSFLKLYFRMTELLLLLLMLLLLLGNYTRFDSPPKWIIVNCSICSIWLYAIKFNERFMFKHKNKKKHKIKYSVNSSPELLDAWHNYYFFQFSFLEVTLREFFFIRTFLLNSNTFRLFHKNICILCTKLHQTNFYFLTILFIRSKMFSSKN